MLRALVSTASRLLLDLNRSLMGDRLPDLEKIDPPPTSPRTFRRLERVVLTDEISRTLFEEYAEHRQGSRGDEETGWVLLGLREETEALVLATLPAGAERSAGVAHVRFNSDAQGLASRIVRQSDRRLVMLGLVHTHPGSLRHPSDGDFQGDSQWVGCLRGGEGVFGIGTADAESPPGTAVAWQPRPHVQCLGELRLSWYALKQGDRRYRPLPVGLTLGPDLARPLHSVWATIEAHAESLDRLCRQQNGVKFQVTKGPGGPALLAQIPLATPGANLQLILGEAGPRYHVVRDGEMTEVTTEETRVDRGVYLLLAELAGQS
jgi:proteasome lid subunit RPN8/RPN11